MDGEYFYGVGAKQIGRIRKKQYAIKTKKDTEEISYIITGINKEEAGPKRLLDLAARHWSIENKLHRIRRDTIFMEDISNITSHQSQQNNASLKNLAIFLLNKLHSSLTIAIEAVNLCTSSAFSLFKLKT